MSAFVASHPSKTAKGGAPSSDLLPDGETSFSPADALKAELEKKDAEIKRLTRELDQVRMKSASSSTANVGEKIKEVKGVKVLAHRVDNLERAQLRTLVDQLRDKIGSGVVILGSASDGNVALIVGVTKDLTSRVQAGKVIGPVAQKVGGKGGGRPDLAEAGGKDASALDGALDGAYGVVEELPEMSSGEPLDDRLQFVKHKGQTIFVIDFSNCSSKEIMLLLDLVRADVAGHAPGSVLTLADFSGAQIDKTVATHIKEVLAFDRPYVKKSAWVGTEELAACVLRAFQELLAAGIADV